MSKPKAEILGPSASRAVTNHKFSQNHKNSQMLYEICRLNAFSFLPIMLLRTE
jgi:hypothetical protein